jgi:hypothetical protein
MVDKPQLMKNCKLEIALPGLRRVKPLVTDRYKTNRHVAMVFLTKWGIL